MKQQKRVCKICSNVKHEKIPAEEAAKTITEIILALTPAYNKASFDKSHNMLFDTIDTNKNRQSL